MIWSSFKIWSFMALRFIIRHKRKTVATGSFIILGTVVLVFLHGLTVGINDTMVLNSTRLHYGDAFVQFPAAFENPEASVQKIVDAAPVRKALFRCRFSSLVSSTRAQSPVVFYAVHPDAEAPTTAIAGRIISGSYPAAQKKEVLLGEKTAEHLQVTVGDMITILESSGIWLDAHRVSGIFKTEIPHFDNTVGYIPIQVLGASVRKQNRAEMAIFMDPKVNLEQAIKQISRLLPDTLSIQSWDALMPDLIQLIEMNEIAMQIIILFVFILVGFGISNSFVLTIVERFREFGILKAMGVTPRELVGLIFLESFMVCFTATLVGLVIGWLLVHIFAQVGIDFSSLTSHNRYFVVSGLVKPRAVLASFYWPGLLSVIVSVISSYMPTRIAARKAASETLRYT
jgi:ABC-type lipoprotein release transport system permease subunit